MECFNDRAICGSAGGGIGVGGVSGVVIEVHKMIAYAGCQAMRKSRLFSGSMVSAACRGGAQYADPGRDFRV